MLEIYTIHEIENKNSISISAFGYENKGNHPSYVSKKCCEEKSVNLLLIRKEGKRQYFLIKDFNTFTYNHTLNRDKTPFWHYCLEAFIIEHISTLHIKDCFKVIDKQRCPIPTKDEYVKFRNYERKEKLPFIIYACFESIQVPEVNVKIQKSLLQTYTKSILFAVMAIN